MKRLCVLVVCLAVTAAGVALGGAGESVVNKVAETFDEAPWSVGAWSSAAGASSLSDEAAPDAPGGKSMLIEARFAGHGFEHLSADPAGPLAVPGEAKSVTVRFRGSDKRYPLILRFQDGWGRTKIGNTKLEWSIPADADGKWKTSTFTIPADWVRPISILGVTTHNWSAQADANTVRFWLDQLEVRTDIGGVDAATGALKAWKPDPDEKDAAKAAPPRTPLVTVEFSTGVEANVFSRESPGVCVRIRNWKPGKLTGTLTCRIADADGKQVDSQRHDLAVQSIAAPRLGLKAERFGLYTLQAELSLSDGTRRESRMSFARVPPYRDLSEAEKLSSPYGLNVHGGGERMLISPFRKAGLIWFRDYAFSYEWLLRAKGADRRYAGWPGYPKLLARYADAGVMLLPCLSKAIQAPAVRDGKVVGRVGPDRPWAAAIADIAIAFPRITHWELGNEYDLNQDNRRAEELVDWRNYRAYHRKFGEILSVLGDGALVAVEQGRAGIWPGLEEQCVRSGDFDPIGVINSHHYCGVSAPETDLGEADTAMDAASPDRRPALLFDRLRAVKRAAVCDGKPRQSWLTEFGWDTLAGKVVTPRQQAAYLARGWMLALAAGTDKCFWFYDYDAPKPIQFFDGCGLVTAGGEPKLALCALAGLTSILPSPRCVGGIEAGPNTAGYVFESDGKLVAALWAVEGEDGPEVAFPAGELHDYLGNKLAGRSAKLTAAPVYAVGIDKDGPWFRQAAYGLDTPYLVAATAGDPVRPVLRIRNGRAKPIRCTVRMDLPKGWTAQSAETAAEVPPGSEKLLPLPLVVAPDEELSTRTVMLTIAEDAPVKRIALQVMVQPPLAIAVGPIQGPPGETGVQVRLGNRTAKEIDGTLRLHLPASWKALTPEIKISGLKPRETRQVECRFRWSADWTPSETACAEFDAGGGRRISRSIIPNRLRLHRAGKLAIDGRLDDWPDALRLPDWVLGSTLGQAGAKVFLAWAPEGLYGAVEVRDSKLQVSDPRSFWAGDCLEVFLDTRDDKRSRSYQTGDHQFWLVPLAAEARVYAGQWKRGDETPATRYDIRAVRGVSRPTADGYVMEFLLPAAELKGYQPKPGGRVGLNLVLTVKGKRFDREVYWPAAKGSGVLNQPNTWGTMEMEK